MIIDHEVSDLSAAARSRLYAGQNLWGAHGLGQRKLICGVPERRFVRTVDDQPVCHVGLVERLATVNGEPLPILGLGSIVTVESARGQGHARSLIRYVLDTLAADASQPAAYAVLFCLEHRRSLYATTGWAPISVAEVRQYNLDQPTLIRPPYHAYWRPVATGTVIEPLRTLDVRSLPW